MSVLCSWKFFASIALSACLLLVDPSVLNAANESCVFRDKWALVVGIGKCQDSSISLGYPTLNAKAFADYLTRDAHFAPDHVRLLTDEAANHKSVLRSIGDWISRAAKPDDLVVVYISGYGSDVREDSYKVSYVAPYDAERKDLFATGISVDQLPKIIRERISAKTLNVVVDASFSGSSNVGPGKSLQRGNFADASQSDAGGATGAGVTIVLTSSTGEQAGSPTSVSAFTRALIDQLKANPDWGIATVFESVKSKVIAETSNGQGGLQTPSLKCTVQPVPAIVWSSRALAPAPPAGHATSKQR